MFSTMSRFLFILLLFIPLVAKSWTLSVVDSSDGTPLAGATLLMPNGTIVGLTDSRGRFDGTSASMPLTVRCMGYEEQYLAAPVDTVFLSPANFELSEIVVIPEERPVLKLRCYLREYTTAMYGGDTIQMVGEYAADYFLTEKKVKGFGKKVTPYIRAKKLRVRHKNAEGLDSIARPSEDEEFLSWISICSINPTGQTVPDSILNGAVQTVQGKYGLFATTRTVGNKLETTCDILANHKDHHWSPLFFKLIGFTIDTSEMLMKTIHRVDENGKCGPNTLQMATYTMEMTIKSKFIKRALHTKDPVKTYSVFEVYPIEARYLTVKQAKELEWDYSDQEIIVPSSAPELPANVKEMLTAPIK